MDRQILCPACFELVRLSRSVNPMEPLTWYMVNEGGALHAKTCRPKAKRQPRAKPSGPMLPMMKDHYSGAERTEGMVGG